MHLTGFPVRNAAYILPKTSVSLISGAFMNLNEEYSNIGGHIDLRIGVLQREAPFFA